MYKLAYIIICLLIIGCGTPTYYKCPSCGAAYRQYWYQKGLPKGGKPTCECGTRLYETDKENSGWNDKVEPNLDGYYSKY